MLRRGFTFIEMAVAIVALAILTTLVATLLLPRIRQSESAALAETMDAIGNAIVEFRTDVRRYPLRLSYLSAPPAAGTTDLCGQTIPTSYLTEWRGPYVRRALGTSGFRIAESTVQDTLGRSPAAFTVTTDGSLIVVTTDVDSAVARRVERSFDPTADFLAGTLRWSDAAPLDGRGTMTYHIPVRGC